MPGRPIPLIPPPGAPERCSPQRPPTSSAGQVPRAPTEVAHYPATSAAATRGDPARSPRQPDDPVDAEDSPAAPFHLPPVRAKRLNESGVVTRILGADRDPRPRRTRFARSRPYRAWHRIVDRGIDRPYQQRRQGAGGAHRRGTRSAHMSPAHASAVLWRPRTAPPRPELSARAAQVGGRSCRRSWLNGAAAGETLLAQRRPISVASG